MREICRKRYRKGKERSRRGPSLLLSGRGGEERKKKKNERHHFYETEKWGERGGKSRKTIGTPHPK